MNIKGLMIVSLSFLVFFGCEVTTTELVVGNEATLIGTWTLSNQGDYANADCTGELDYTEWEEMVLDSFALSITLNEDGSGTIAWTEGSETGTAEFTWTNISGIFCFIQSDGDADCSAYTLSNTTWEILEVHDPFCRDENTGDHTEHTETECLEMDNHIWEIGDCTLSTWTKS